MFEGGNDILLYSQPIDMRRGIDGLCILIAEKLKREPHSGTLYVFYNRRLDKLKILYWQRNGFCVWYKRLERDRFQIKAKSDTVILSIQQLRWLLDGLDYSRIEAHKAVAYNTYY